MQPCMQRARCERVKVCPRQAGAVGHNISFACRHIIVVIADSSCCAMCCSGDRESVQARLDRVRVDARRTWAGCVKQSPRRTSSPCAVQAPNSACRHACHNLRPSSNLMLPTLTPTLTGPTCTHVYKMQASQICRHAGIPDLSDTSIPARCPQAQAAMAPDIPPHGVTCVQCWGMIRDATRHNTRSCKHASARVCCKQPFSMISEAVSRASEANMVCCACKESWHNGQTLLRTAASTQQHCDGQLCAPRTA